ncbi:MAG: RNase P subunit p30 family protein [Candidatus Nanohaloarchaea archaeon]
MPEFHDLLLENTAEKVCNKASELGWDSTNCSLDTVFLEADNWGELKRKMNEKRPEADILVFKGGDEELNRKACETSKIDVLLHPEKGRKDSGLNHVMAEAAAENNVTIGLDFSMLERPGKERMHVLTHWRRNLKLCEKYDARYLITTSAEEKYDLRAPRELKALIDSIGYPGRKAVVETPAKILRDRGLAEDSK